MTEVNIERPDVGLELETYLLPNKAIPKETNLGIFHALRSEVERAAGLLIFDKMSDSRFVNINGKRQQQ